MVLPDSFDCSFGWTWRECYEVAGTEGTIVAPKAWGNSEGECSFTLIREGTSRDGDGRRSQSVCR